MGTSKEMKLKVIDKMRKNIEDDVHMMSGIEYEVVGKWYEVKSSLAHVFNMNVMKYRVKPETIKVNGVDIPKPLEKDDLLSMKSKEKVYSVSSNCHLYIEMYSYIAVDQCYEFVYKTKEEAIEASRLLFGIKQ